jgi:hypothetical protein
MMTLFDHAVRLLGALPFEQRIFVVYAGTCWSDEKFNSTAGETGHVAVKLLRELSAEDRAAALYEASPRIELKPKPKPMLKLVSNNGQGEPQ